MGRQAKQQATEPIGVLQSLTSGFDFVTRHPDLMLPPILLDVFLWLGPRLSAYPLFTALLDLLNSPDMREALGPAQAQQVDAVQKLIDQAGQAFNLFWWLSPSLLGVPGLMVGSPADKTPAGQPLVWPISSGLAYFGLFVVLNLLGLGVAAIYWSVLSSRVRQLPIGVRRTLALWWGLLKIAVLLTVVALIIGLPTLLVATVVSLLSLVASQFVVMLGGSLVLWALFYMIYTIHGIALRDVIVLQAIRMSVTLMRAQFLPAMSLILVSVGIYISMGFVWNIPPSDSWLRAAGILGHAFTATGLFAATALFYMDRTKPVASGQ
jgi:hypothetical protein